MLKRKEVEWSGLGFLAEEMISYKPRTKLLLSIGLRRYKKQPGFTVKIKLLN
jgi:hypothetical protein